MTRVQSDRLMAWAAQGDTEVVCGGIGAGDVAAGSISVVGAAYSEPAAQSLNHVESRLDAAHTTLNFEP